jgi:hypothetical protein
VDLLSYLLEIKQKLEQAKGKIKPSTFYDHQLISINRELDNLIRILKKESRLENESSSNKRISSTER